MSYIVRWSPNRDYAIVDERLCQRNDHGFRNCYRQSLAFYDWETGERSVLPDHLTLPHKMYGSPRLRDDMWSSDNSKLVLSDDNKGRLHVLDAVTRHIFPIEIDGIVNWYWIDSQDIVLIAEHPTENLQRLVYRYDWETHSIRELTDISPHIEMGWDMISVSPHGTYIGHYGSWESVQIQNLQTGESLHYPLSSNMVWNDRRVSLGYVWHPDEAWFFSESAFNALMIHHIDEPMGRELTLCYGVETCVGFVPDHALNHLDNGDEQSLTPQPPLTIAHDHPIYGVVWNGDGTQLATYSASANDGQLTIWDVSESEPEIAQEWAVEQQCGGFYFVCPMSWDTETNTIFITAYRMPSYEHDMYSFNVDTHAVSVIETELDYYDWLSPENRYRIEGENNNPPYYIVDNVTDESLPDIEFLTPLRSTFFDFSLETGLLVSAGYERASIWDITTGERLTELNWVGAMAVLSPDATQVAFTGNNSVAIWDMTPYIEQINP